MFEDSTFFLNGLNILLSIPSLLVQASVQMWMVHLVGLFFPGSMAMLICFVGGLVCLALLLFCGYAYMSFLLMELVSLLPDKKIMNLAVILDPQDC